MPLIIVTGTPCTGKTIFSQTLCSKLTAELGSKKSVEIVNAESLKISTRHGFKDAASEKITRGII